MADTTYNFQHGQHVMYYPAWTLESMDDMTDWGEEVVIDEVLDPDMIVVRYLNSDATTTARSNQLSAPFGDPCRCREGEYCHVGN
jgi:hypothetical protein